MRYFIELSYNGKAYHGWQIQPNATTVQETIEKALSTLLGTPTSIVAAGRTDAGVHALQMFAHFDYEKPVDEKQLSFKLNAFLPKDIAIHAIFEVPSNAHARFDALSRSYIYRISTQKDVFNYEFAYQLKRCLDVDKMNAASKILYDYADFQCFSKSKTDVKTYLCDIHYAHWTSEKNEFVFEIKANRFLRNMVRAIVGTCVEIGLGKLKVDDMHRIIKSKDRGEAGYSVPAHGLYLSKIEYPKTLINNV